VRARVGLVYTGPASGSRAKDSFHVPILRRKKTLGAWWRGLRIEKRELKNANQRAAEASDDVRF
jgi:hypothetical protein